jgi:hypothetical protein
MAKLQELTSNQNALRAMTEVLETNQNLHYYMKLAYNDGPTTSAVLSSDYPGDTYIKAEIVSGSTKRLVTLSWWDETVTGSGWTVKFLASTSTLSIISSNWTINKVFLVTQ